MPHNRFYHGKRLKEDDTIEQLQILPKSKLLCAVSEFDIKTFKRFRAVDEGRGWYLSRSSADAVTFIPQVPIKLFGFGMHFTREGQNDYSLEYEILLDDSSVRKETVEVVKADPDKKVMQVFFGNKQDCIEVSSRVKIGIVVRYPRFDDSSRLYIGEQGSDCDEIEGNERGVFAIESNSHCGNGTSETRGQIPEVYYMKA